MLALDVLVVGVTVLAWLQTLPLVIAELSFTLVMFLKALLLAQLYRRGRQLRWRLGMLCFSIAAALVALANLTWVYGSLVGSIGNEARYIGSLLYALSSMPFAIAVAEGLFKRRQQPVLSLFSYSLAYLAAILTVAVCAIASMTYFGGDEVLAVVILDSVVSYVTLM